MHIFPTIKCRIYTIAFKTGAALRYFIDRMKELRKSAIMPSVLLSDMS